MTLVVLYNLLLAGVDVLALRGLARERNVAALLRAVAWFFAAASALAVAGMLAHEGDRYHGSAFVLMGLFACALFAHGIPLLLAAAVLLWSDARRAAAVSGALGALMALVALDAFVVEPRALEVTHHRVTTAKLTEPVRVVVLSDLQAERLGAHEREAVQRAMALEPDLLLLPGDYGQVDAARFEAFLGELNALFREEALAAPLGIHAVEGNVDRPGWPAAFAGLGATTYVETATTRTGRLSVTGLSFADSFRTDLVVPPAPGFHVVLGHAPDFALGRVEADLLVAGHTHGGQVRLPWIGPLLTLSSVPRAWASGRTSLPGGRTLVVSRGIGMERGLAPRVRFLCRPELVVIDLVPEADPVTPRGAPR